MVRRLLLVAAEIAAVIHPFAHMTSNYAFAQRGLDAFGRPAAPGAEVAAGSGFQAAADEVAVAPESRAGAPASAAAPANHPEIPPSGVALEAPPSEPPPAPQPAPASPEPVERLLPNIPRFADVPPEQQWPDGPYRQAPPEFGGEWWQVSPFTGEQPWLQIAHVGDAPAAEEPPPAVPAEFARIFGEEPDSRGQVDRIRWEQDLRYFKQAGVPEGFTAEQVETASRLFETWGLGRPQFYEGRYGWAARFPDSAIPDFQANPHTALEASHLVVARYQVRLAQAGEAIPQRHPFVPPQVFGDAEDV